MSRNFNYPNTCPRIDKNIKNFQSDLTVHLNALVEELNPMFYSTNERWRIYKGNLGITFTKNRWDNYRFSNREEAEDYILMNNSKYSLNNIIETIKELLPGNNLYNKDFTNAVIKLMGEQ